jgi:hypothetical protein
MKRFRAFVYAGTTLFSATGNAAGRDCIRICGLARRKAEHLVLARPLRWQVAEASNANAMGEPAIDCRFDEIGREESKQDCLVNFSRAAIFPLGDAVRARRWISDKFG